MTYRFCRALACAALLAIALALLAGCGSSASTSGSSPSPTATAGTAQEAPTVMTDGIIKGEFDKGSMTLVKAASVQSTEAPDFYFVAMKFNGPGGEQVGVWATKFLDAGGMIWSVNDVAQNTTEWPPSNTAGAKLSMSTQGAQQAADAVQ